MKNILFAISILTIFCFAKCKKDKTDFNGLPPATQSGKNTFGFLLNGQPWTPAGYNGGTSNLSLYYDETFSAGVFNIGAYRVNSSGLRQRINFYGDSIQGPRKIILPSPQKFGIVFTNNDSSMCSSYDVIDSGVTIKSGFFDIQKLDKINHIFSGEFEIVITKKNCLSLKITSGRFDLKY